MSRRIPRLSIFSISFNGTQNSLRVFWVPIHYCLEWLSNHSMSTTSLQHSLMQWGKFSYDFANFPHISGRCNGTCNGTWHLSNHDKMHTYVLKTEAQLPCYKFGTKKKRPVQPQSHDTSSLEIILSFFVFLGLYWLPAPSQNRPRCVPLSTAVWNESSVVRRP